MLKMVDGTGIIGVDMICPLGVSTPQPPNYDKVELEGTGMLVLPNSLDAPLERLELGGKTEQAQTTGKNLLPDKFSIYAEGKSKTNLKLQIGNYVYSSKTSKNLYILHEDKSNITNGWTATNKFNFKIDKEETIEVRIEAENPLEILPMIREETELDSYEPYTGGKPSPSPEYPQEIKSVGKWNGETQKYEVDVQVCNSGYLQKGSYADKIRAFPLEKGKTYRIRVNRNSAVVNAFILNEEKAFKNSAELYTTCNHAGLTNVNDTGIVEGKCKIPQLLYSGYAFTVTVGGLFLYQGVNNSRLNTDDAYVVYDFIKTVNENQPYVEQTLTLTSDRPITKWDKLVEQGGQIGWLYQSEIDDNVKPSRTDLFPYGFSLYKNQENGTYTYKSTNIKKAIGFQTSYCKQFRNKDAAYQSAELWHYSDQPSMKIQYFNTDIATVEEFIEWMESNPLTMVFKTESATFAPLPQSEQNAIRALSTYYPTTVITVDGGELDPDIKVTYRKEK